MCTIIISYVSSDGILEKTVFYGCCYVNIVAVFSSCLWLTTIYIQW